MAGGHGTIGIHFIPSDGYHWAEFLQQKLNEDGYNIKSMLLDLTTTSHSHFFETNILLVSPDFFSLSNIGALLSIDPHSAIMVLLGTDSSTIRKFLYTHKCTEMLKYITFFETEATENCVRELLIGIIKLYEHVHETSASDEEKEQYDILPPPRRSLTKTASQTPNNCIHSVAVSCNEDREVYILCDRKGSEEIQIQLTDDQSPLKAVHENKAIYRFTIDKNITQRNLQFTAKDGQLIIGTGKVIMPNTDKKNIDVKGNKSKLEILQEFLGKEDDPICLMCKALNLTENSKEALDRNLANKCKSLETLRRFEGTFFEIDRKSIGHSNELWPTLLHFAAEFNLPQFCEELLKLPYSMDETLKMNKDSETPLDISKRKGHSDVSDKLNSFTDKQTRNGNVPGNKDSGVVEDDIQQQPPVPTLTSSDTYADMSQINTDRDSSLVVDSDVYDIPPPSPHSSKTYVNCDNPPPPVAHIPSRPKLSSGESGSDTGSVYMEMTGKSAPNLTELHHDHYSHDLMHRTKSESAAPVQDDDDDHEDYEEPGDIDEISDSVSFDIQSIHSSSSYQDNMSTRVEQEGVVPEIQLPTQAHNSHRHSGFFKKFKLFGKHTKKEKEKKQRGRKMSLPTEIDIQAFQKYRSERRGSIPHVQNRTSSSSTSSEETSHPAVYTREDKAKSMDPFAEDTHRKKKKHFLNNNRDARKSMRITKAMADQAINPLPLPSRSRHQHLYPPEL